MQEPVEAAKGGVRRTLVWAERGVRFRLDQTRGGRFALDILRGSGAVLRHLREEPVFGPAAALAYGTLLSIVPLLGVVLAIAGATRFEQIRTRVHEAIFLFLAPGVQKASQDALEELIARATSGGVVSLSGAGLFVSAVLMLRSVEKTLNEIWGVRTLRDWRIRLATYLLILVAGPVLLGLSLAATAALRDQVFEQVPAGTLLLGASPVLATILGLTLLYWLAPNAPVRKRAAFAGAIVSGSAFEGAKHVYAFYTSHFVHYSVLYGSLGAIPLFLVWVYVTWVILLFGAQLAYAVQHAGALRLTALPQTEAMRAQLAARTLLAAAVASLRGHAPPSIDTVARATNVSAIAVGECVRLLSMAGLLTRETNGDLVPARPIDRISLADVAQAARAASPVEAEVLGTDAASQVVVRTFARAFEQGETAALEPLAKVSLKEMAEQVSPAGIPS